MNNSDPRTEIQDVWSSFSIKEIPQNQRHVEGVCWICLKFPKQTNTKQESSFLVLASIAPKGAAKLIKDCEHYFWQQPWVKDSYIAVSNILVLQCTLQHHWQTHPSTQKRARCKLCGVSHHSNCWTLVSHWEREGQLVNHQDYRTFKFAKTRRVQMLYWWQSRQGVSQSLG